MQTHHPRLGFGADDAGLVLKDYLVKELTESQSEYVLSDFGVYSQDDPTAYPETGLRVAQAVAARELDRAILICGTGLGMAISANKVMGVRAAVAYDAYSVERSVLSNNCQVLALGARVIAPPLALAIARQWLSLRFDESSASARKVEILTGYEIAQADRGPDTGRAVE